MTQTVTPPAGFVQVPIEPTQTKAGTSGHEDLKRQCTPEWMRAA